MAAKKEPKHEMTAAEKKAVAERDARLKKAGWGQNRSAFADITPWNIGLIVMGTFLKYKKLPDRDGRTGGHIFYIENTEGVRECYGAPAALFPVIEELASGTELYIECTGKRPSSKGSDAWMFDVRTRE